MKSQEDQRVAGHWIRVTQNRDLIEEACVHQWTRAVNDLLQSQIQYFALKYFFGNEEVSNIQFQKVVFSLALLGEHRRIHKTGTAPETTDNLSWVGTSKNYVTETDDLLPWILPTKKGYDQVEEAAYPHKPTVLLSSLQHPHLSKERILLYLVFTLLYSEVQGVQQATIT